MTNSQGDPLEYNNLIVDEEHIDIESELKEALFKWLLDRYYIIPKSHTLSKKFIENQETPSLNF
ncbi:MAG: hypothetical protein ACFFHV_10745 [Promethearchaeota archaeon]